MLTVLFASVLFFGGVGTKFESIRIKQFMLGIGVVVFIGAFIAAVSFPIA